MLAIFGLFLLIVEALLLGLLFWVLFKIGLWRFLDRNLPFSFFREGYDGSMNLNGLTYQGQSFWLAILSLTFSVLFLFMAVGTFGIKFGLFLIFFVPGIVLLLRIRTFNESNILPETGLGYDPFLGFKFSFFSSWPGLMFGFTGLFLNPIPWYVPFLIPMGFIFALIPLFPDYINKYLSYDIRSKKAFDFFQPLGIFGVILQLVIWVIF